tara:strand:+ start:867 stop:1142 length:276 start_codon:yes stop_codon:yes gene_type:complete
MTSKTPCIECLKTVAEMSIRLEKPICLDYYLSSCEKTCQIARDGPDGDKLLYKNQEEYTSPLKSMFKVGGDMVLETQNSLYVVSQSMIGGK